MGEQGGSQAGAGDTGVLGGNGMGDGGQGQGRGGQGGQGQGGQGNTPDNTEFLSTLPEDIRGHEALKGVQDLSGLAKAFVEAKTTNAPATPEDYSTEGHKHLPEEISKAAVVMAHKAGMTQEQVTAVLAHMNRIAEQSKAHMLEDQQKAEGELRAAWGVGFEGNVAKVNNLLKRVAGDQSGEVADLLNKSGLSSNKTVMGFLLTMADSIREATLAPGTGGGGGGPRGMARTEGGMPMLNFPSMAKYQG